MYLQYGSLPSPSSCRRLVAILFIVGVPVSAWLGLVLATTSGDFLASHKVFHWAVSCGDIGEGLALAFQGALAGLLGWSLGVFAPVRNEIWFLRYVLWATVIPLLMAITATLSLASHGTYGMAARICLCIAFCTCLLAGALGRGCVERFGTKQTTPNRPLRQKLAWVILTFPVLLLAGGLVALHLSNPVE